MSPSSSTPLSRAVGTIAVLALGTISLAASASAQASSAQSPSSRAILADLDAYVAKSLAEWKGAGVAIGIVRDDSLIYAKGFGVREVGKPERVDDRTVFAIGSNTKFFTAVAAGMLVDDGKLALDDKVTKHLPWFQLHDPWVTREFTLRDAMSHRSGLGRRGDPLWYGTPYSRDEIVRRVRYLVPNQAYRSDFGYQNIMFLAAGQVIAAAAGKSWDDVVRERIFAPLGMSSSSTSVREIATVANLARPHTLRSTEARPTPIPYRDIDNVAPAGSINSNVQDMARWMRLILGGGSLEGKALLKPSTLAELTAPHTVATRIVADTLFPSRHFSLYGLGIGLSDLHGVKVLQHTGGIDGMLSYVAMVPERRLGIVVLTNVAGHNALYTALGTRILSAFLGGPTRDWSAISLASAAREEERAAERVQSQMRQRVADSRPSRALGEYAGTYRHAMYGDVTVTLEGDALAVRYPNAVDLRLEHFTFDTFLGHEKGSSLLASEALPVRFSLDALGRVSAMELTGVETFTRVRP
jgi:CubicO group peptidase (beta-lactamase class C family)